MITRKQYDNANKIINEYKSQKDNHNFRLAKLIKYKLNKYIPNTKFIVIEHKDWEGNDYEIKGFRKK